MNNYIYFILINLKIKIKILIFLFISIKLSFLLFDDEFNKKKNRNNKFINNAKKIKVCVCTLGKKENKYIREFINHYKNYAIDKIFLYDNNNINDERFDTVLYDYLKNKYVKIINYRGMSKPQFKIFKECYKMNKRKFDWLLYYDLDEYIHLKNYPNIKHFLLKKEFKKCKLIYLNTIRHTDNDLLFYDNRTLAERFPYINWASDLVSIKSMIRGNLKKVKFRTSHLLDRKIIGCNSLGKKVNPKILIDRKKIIIMLISFYIFKDI